MRPDPIPRRTILHLTAMHSAKYAAMEHFLLELARACTRDGYRTVLQYESLPQSSSYRRELEASGVTVVPIGTLVNPIGSICRAGALIRSVRPEIIHAHFVSGYVLLALPFLARALGTKKLIATIHNEIDLGRVIFHRKFAYGLFDHVLGVSQAVSRSVLESGVTPGVVATHYLGLFGPRDAPEQLRDRLRSQYGIPGYAVVIACIAYDTPRKGLDLLLEALQRLRRCHRPVHLIVIGVESGRSALPETATALGVADRVHWAGIQDEGWRVLAAADIYAQPSRAEGIGLAIMEAMALRLPVVASRVGGIPEAVVDAQTGFLVEPGDASGLAAAIQRLVASPALSRELGEAGYVRYTRLFNGENSVRDLVQRYYGLEPPR